jgi:branched-chain amino acid transport system substrate-binding protein
MAFVAAFLAGCSSSSHETSSATPTSAAGGTAQAGSAAKITVEGVLTLADFGPGATKAAQARFNAADNSGEIPGGRKINYLGAVDDQGTPDGNLSVVRRLVNQDHVFAIVPALSPFLEFGSGLFINQQKTPTVGWGISPAFCQPSEPSNMYLFGFNGCLTPPIPTYASNLIPGPLTKLFQAEGKGGPQGKTVAIIGDNNDANKLGNQAAQASLANAGFKVVYVQNPLPGPIAQITDYSPYVQALMTANGGKPPDAISVTSGIAEAIGLGKALQQAGYKGVISQPTYAPQVTKAAAGLTAETNFATPESNAPDMARIVSTLQAAGISPIGLPELAGYLSADMFIQILKKVGSDLTAQRFQQVAASFRYEIPGVVGPTYYPAGFQVSPPCGEMVTSDGTKWTITAAYAC